MLGVSDVTRVILDSFGAIGTIAVGVVAASIARRAARSDRDDFLARMADQWWAVKDDWNYILLASEGPDYHYADASPTMRAEAGDIYRAFQRDNEFMNAVSGIEGNPSDQLLPEEDGDLDSYDAALKLRVRLRSVTRVLLRAANSVISGRMTTAEAYDIFGADVARHYRFIITLSHRQPTGKLFEQATEFNTFDQSDCLYVFAFLLRAEQARRGDTYGHFIVELARSLRGLEGRAVDSSLHRLYLTRKKRNASRSIRRLFNVAKTPRVESVFLVPIEPIVDPADHVLFRRRFEPQSRTERRIRAALVRRGPVED